MKHPFPIRSGSGKTADIGIDVVASVVHNDLAWIFRKTPLESDFGIDGYIDIVTPEGYVTGRSLAVQIKCGASYFKTETSNGWLYRGEFKHINYYANSPTRIVLVIVDDRSRRAWWRMFEAYETSRTSSGWTIEIPSSNSLDREAKKALSELAGKHVDYLPHLEDFWAIERRMGGSDMLLIQIQRFEVESLNIRPFARIFERLAEADEVRRASMGKVDFLIDGYNDDSRELTEIPEVVLWLKEAARTVKYLLYFLCLEPLPLGQGIRQIMAAHCVMRRVDGGLGVEDPAVLREFTTEMFGWLNDFTAKHDLEDFNRLRSEQYLAVLEEFLGVGAARE